MKKLGTVAILSVVLSLPAVAAHQQDEASRNDRGPISKIVHIIKKLARAFDDIGTTKP